MDGKMGYRGQVLRWIYLVGRLAELSEFLFPCDAPCERGRVVRWAGRRTAENIAEAPSAHLHFPALSLHRRDLAAANQANDGHRLLFETPYKRQPSLLPAVSDALGVGIEKRAHVVDRAIDLAESEREGQALVGAPLGQATAVSAVQLRVGRRRAEHRRPRKKVLPPFASWRRRN